MTPTKLIAVEVISATSTNVFIRNRLIFTPRLRALASPKRKQVSFQASRYKSTAHTSVTTAVMSSESHVVRMKVPSEGVCVVPDMLRGDVEIPWDRMDMQVLMKADGLPTYFLANVVDDHLMGITHVLRGEEWLPSAPKLIKLYEYFGWEQPKLCYMPLLRNPDKSKLSKRKNPTCITFYERMGYLPDGVRNMYQPGVDVAFCKPCKELVMRYQPQDQG